MIKEKKILTYFIVWLIIGFCILFIGINNVFAATYDTNYNWEIRYYDNNGSSATAVGSSWNESLQTYISNNITTVSGSYGAGVSFSSPIPLIQNHTYTLSLYFPDRNNIALSSKSFLLLGSNLDDAKNKYVNGTWSAETIQSKVLNNSIIQFVFKANYSLNYIFLPWTTTSTVTQDYFFTQVIMEDLGSEGVSIDDINSSLSNQTNELNNSIQNSTNEIKGEINDMEQSIIDSNKETQDVIKDQFEKCEEVEVIKEFTYRDITNNGYYLDNSGNLVSLESFGIIEYFEIKKNTNYTILKNDLSNAPSYCLYDENKTLISCQSYNRNERLEFNSGNAKYISFSMNNSIGTYINLIFLEEKCSNRLDETNDKLDDLNNNITDDNIDDNNVSNAFNEFENFIDENATISSLITLPVTLFTAILNGMQNNCSSFNLGSLYGEDLILPCIDISSYLGSTLWTMIDIIISGFAIYYISKKFIKVFNTFSSMKEGDVIDD